MQTKKDYLDVYSEFIPTVFDTHLHVKGRENWYIVPVSRTRDSGPLGQSNFETALEWLGGESETVEVHTFGHWGPGWYQIILVSPSDEKALGVIKEIRSALENYPVLSDDDFSSREYEAQCEAWENMSVKERITFLRRDGGDVSVFAARRDEIPEGLRDTSALVESIW